MMTIARSLPCALASAALVAAVTGCDGCDEPRGGPIEGLAAEDDIDGDGIADWDDGDIDGDGVDNAVDSDMDGDGVANGEDGDPDGDGKGGIFDDTPYGVNPDGATGPWSDNDGDGAPNIFDEDDDDDGIADGVNGQGDCDGDGVAEPENFDCDGYCIADEQGLVPCDDGRPPGSGAPDTDGDSVPDSVDPDDDADGVPDVDDPAPDGDVGDPPIVDTPADPPPPPPPPPPPACSTETFDPAQPIPPRILLVVDRSLSMDEAAPGFGNSKWEATREALVGPLFGSDHGVVGQLEDHVELGLFTYPADSADDVCAPGSLVRFIDLNNHQSIKTALYFTSPTGATPTAASLTQAKAVLDFMPVDGGQRAIILATDGGPNCNRSLDGDTCRCVGTQEQCQQYPANCLDDVNAVAASAALSAAGYPVYVLGIDGALSFADVLTAMAQAGGTGDYFGVASADALATTVEQIATDVGSCRFDVAGFPDESTLTVKIDGAVVGHDDSRSNGWDLVGLSTLELFGAACDSAHAANAVTVERCE